MPPNMPPISSCYTLPNSRFQKLWGWRGCHVVITKSVVVPQLNLSSECNLGNGFIHYLSLPLSVLFGKDSVGFSFQKLICLTDHRIHDDSGNPDGDQDFVLSTPSCSCNHPSSPALINPFHRSSYLIHWLAAHVLRPKQQKKW